MVGPRGVSLLNVQPEDFVLSLFRVGVGCGFCAKRIGLSPGSLSLGTSSMTLPREEVESFGVTMPKHPPLPAGADIEVRSRGGMAGAAAITGAWID